MMRRWFWRLGFFAIIVVAGGWAALQAYLNSDHARQLAAQKIAAAINAKVGIGGLEVGVNGCALTQLQVFENSKAAAEPFLIVDRVESDLTLSDIVQGTAEPKQLTFIRPQLLIRHDANGHLLTQFPKPKPSDQPMPKIRVQDAIITIRKAGEPDAVFHDVDADVTSIDDKIHLTGTVNDPIWGGNWSVAAVLPKKEGPCAIQLKNKGLHVTQSMLERVPYVPNKVWQHVRLEGDTPVDVRLILGAPRDRVLYRVELAPVNTAVYVSSIKLTAAKAHGGVVVENERVLLKDVRGQVADGELALTSADLDFRPVNTVMRFDLAAKNLKIQGLPATWKLPPRLGGLLSGKANIEVVVINGVAVPSGNGEGSVSNAMMGPIPMPNYGLKIQADKNGFRFEPRLADGIIPIPILRSAIAP